MRKSRTPAAIACLVLLAGLTACSSPAGGGAACSSTGAGTLSIAVSGLPAGVDADVTVSGPGSAQTLTGSQRLSLAAGSYTVSAEKVAQAGPIVRTAYSAAVSGSPACVEDGRTTGVEVAYSPIASSNKLWTGNGPGGAAPLLGFASAVLGASGNPAATVAADTQGKDELAFDRDGNLWLAGETTTNPPLLRYPAQALDGSGDKSYDVAINSEILDGGVPRVTALAFDASGNLWAGVGYADTLVMFTAEQIAASGSPAPAAEISGVTDPEAIAFDADGNLWTTSNGQVVKYAAGRLAASTSAPPDLVLDAQSPPPVTGALPSPLGLAFDAGGNLWVNHNGTLARYTPAGLTGTGTKTLTPAVQITLGVTALPEGIAFDEGGGLWLALDAGALGRLSPSQLGTSGTVTPETVIASPNIGYAGDIAIYPAPASLPLYHRLP